MNSESPSRDSLLWIGLWLLASSWLFGLEYFSKPNLNVWAALVALGTLLICFSQANNDGTRPDVPPSRSLLSPVLLAAVLLLPAIFVTPWPHRIAPVLMAGGALLELLSHSRRWLRAASAGFSLGGTILLAQTLALFAYEHVTARSRELPWPLPDLLAGVARLLGVSCAADGSDLVLPTMRLNHHLAATWELFFDPATLCFVVGGLVAFAFGHLARGAMEPGPMAFANAPARASTSARKRKELVVSPPRSSFTISPALKAAGWLLLAAALWLPLRAGLHVGVFLHRALRTEYDAPLNLMNQLWNPWPQLLLLLPLALLVSHWTRDLFCVVAPRPSAAETSPTASAKMPGALFRGAVTPIGLSFATATVLTLAVLWDPVGQRKQGRIAVDEFHSKWEPTDRPMDTEWYGHLSGYNYACLYDFCSRYYEMSRLTNSLTDAALANLDVLILKVPTERFQPAEIDAVARYVERGGSVLLIGEHTDVFNTSYHLNPIARQFGFEFRYDCLFGMESFFDQFYQPQRVRHPVLQNAPGFDFATSCSLDVRGGSGRGVIVATGLKNSMADYHANNYYPQAVDHAAMRAGAFIQLWSTRHGRGRVLAFTDSTIFSNFSAFEPGKVELFLGMLEWLNRQDRLGNPRPLLLLLGAALLGWTAFVAFKQPALRRLMVVVAVFSWSATSLALVAYQRQALPEPKPVRPLTWVTIDRTLCDGPLSKGGFIAGKSDGFGIFERWILRLGYFIKRRSGLDALQGDLVVFLYPTKPVTTEFREGLIRYVEEGGKVLMLDSPTNKLSTAAALLEPFQLSQKPLPGHPGTLSNLFGWPAVTVDAAYEINGGQPLFYLDGRRVAALARHGQGAVVALGFGSRFSDPHMGVTGDVEPDAELRKVFNLQFALIRGIAENKLEAPAPQTAPALVQ